MVLRGFSQHGLPAKTVLRPIIGRSFSNVSVACRTEEPSFGTVLSYTNPAGTHYFEGRCEGTILREERGEGGFGYDSIFRPNGFDRSFAELGIDEKNGISHRGRALRSFFEFFTTEPGSGQ